MMMMVVVMMMMIVIELQSWKGPYESLSPGPLKEVVILDLIFGHWDPKWGDLWHGRHLIYLYVLFCYIYFLCLLE